METTKEIIAQLHLYKHSLVESSIETFLTSKISRNLEVKTPLLKKVFNGIIINLEKDLRHKVESGLGHNISQFFVEIINHDSSLRENFHIQLTIIGIARVVINHFLATLRLEQRGYQNILSVVQKHFDFALIAVSHLWKQLYEEFHERDQTMINELKIVKNGLQKHLDTIYQMIRESPVGALTCDAELMVQHWNPMAIRLTDYHPGDIIRQNVLILFDDKSKDFFLKKLYTDRRWIPNFPLTIIKKDGSKIKALVSISKIKDSPLGMLYYLINFQEVSDGIEYKSHIQRLNQLTAISLLSSSIMHDLRNPLNTIGLNLDLLEQLINRENIKIPENTNNLLATIQNEIQILTSNLNQYLTYSRLTELHIEPIDLNKLIKEIVEDFVFDVTPLNIKVIHKLPKSTFWMQGDLLQLKRVFLNILQNAKEAIQKDGKIGIKVFKRKNRIIIRIKDSGPGILAEHRNKIFQPSFSTKKSGIGLGLYIVREIVHAHKGRISFKSQATKGTTFNISFVLLER